MNKCTFCNEETSGKKFWDENIYTHQKEKFDVCDNCIGDDLKLVEEE